MAKLAAALAAAASNTSSGPVCHGTGDTVLSERVSLESSSALLLLAALARTRLCFRPGWGRGLHIDDEDEPGLEELGLEELDLERRGALLDLPQLVYSQVRPLQRHRLQAL